jgi:hypothetical protein
LVDASSFLDDLIPEAEFAKIMNWAPRTATDARHKGRTPAFIKVGRRIFYRREAIEAWLLGQEVDRSRRVPRRG